MRKFELIETGEKSKVVSFRVGETVYKALERKAEEKNISASEYARSLLLRNLDIEEVGKGDILLDNSTGVLVILVDKETTSLNDISATIMRLPKKKKWMPKSIDMVIREETEENEAQLES